MHLQRDTNTTISGHSMKLRKERCLKRQRRTFFRHRVVNGWNMLTENIVTSPSVNIFKRPLRCLLACSQHVNKALTVHAHAHAHAHAVIPYEVSLDRRRLCMTLSTALAKSRRIASICALLSNAVIQS